jgi:hypothetical protein
MTYSIAGRNLVSGIIVNFADELGFDFNGRGVDVGECTVIDAFGPDGLGDFVDAYVIPAGTATRVHVAIDPDRQYTLIG